MSWTGGCLCGAVRYEINQAPVDANYCHCRMCQRASGSVVTVWAAFPKGAIRFTREKPRLYESSKIAERGFCGNCGSQLFCRPFERDEIDVTIGSLDNPDDVLPEAHWGIESQVRWLTMEDGLPRRRTEEWLDELNVPQEKRPR